jgi:hypothetical protein
VDPSVTLRELRRLAQEILNHDDHDWSDAIELAEFVQAMDVFMTCGGYLPKEWEERRKLSPIQCPIP